MKSRRPDLRAFTLIEIMMVVSIIGLTMVMGFPSFLRMIKREGINKAEYELLHACQSARRAAIMDNKTVTLVIHPIQRTFEVPGAFPASVIPDDVIIELLSVNFGSDEKDEAATVHFFQNGMSDEFTIVMRGAEGSVVTLSLDTVTALPHIENSR